MTGELKQTAAAALIDPKLAGGVGVATLASQWFEWVPIIASGLGGLLSLVLMIIHIWKFTRWLKEER